MQETKTAQTDLGISFADLSTKNLSKGTEIQFTFYWPEANRWEVANFKVLS